MCINTDTESRLVDAVGEVEGGMTWENRAALPRLVILEFFINCIKGVNESDITVYLVNVGNKAEEAFKNNMLPEHGGSFL